MTELVWVRLPSDKSILVWQKGQGLSPKWFPAYGKIFKSKAVHHSHLRRSSPPALLPHAEAAQALSLGHLVLPWALVLPTGHRVWCFLLQLRKMLHTTVHLQGDIHISNHYGLLRWANYVSIMKICSEFMCFHFFYRYLFGYNLWKTFKFQT